MGNKSKPGRPRITPNENVRRVLVSLDPATIDKGRAIGEGNLSEGIRRAVSLAQVPETEQQGTPDVELPGEAQAPI